jgi:hypothetical protein
VSLEGINEQFMEIGPVQSVADGELELDGRAEVGVRL